MNIKIFNLKKKFGNKTVVDIPEFSISSGEILGLVGNNGAGKTTLFRLLLDLIKADEGNVNMTDDELNIDPAQTEAWKQFTGAYIDEGFLIDFLTPEEYFEFIGKTNNISKAETYDRLKQFEAFMGNEIMGQKKYIRNFSAGNKQKIGIISALLNKPSLVILDEPFNFLDPTSQNILNKILEDYNKKNNATILVSSHNLQHTTTISTRIALLEHGKIIRDIPNINESANIELKRYFNIDNEQIMEN